VSRTQTVGKLLSRTRGTDCVYMANGSNNGRLSTVHNAASWKDQRPGDLHRRQPRRTHSRPEAPQLRLPGSELRQLRYPGRSPSRALDPFRSWLCCRLPRLQAGLLDGHLLFLGYRLRIGTVAQSFTASSSCLREKEWWGRQRNPSEAAQTSRRSRSVQLSRLRSRAIWRELRGVSSRQGAGAMFAGSRS
jgi:hypothetical protein